MSDLADIDEAERLRIADDDELASAGRQPDDDAPVGTVVLAQTKTVTTYPTAAGAFFACTTRQLTGTEAEGSAGVGSNLGDTFFAYLPLGAAVPATGTEVVCVRFPNRWAMIR